MRNVPDELYQALREQAEERGTSISEETIRLLKRAVRTDRNRILGLLEEVEAHRPSIRGIKGGAAELIRKDRDSR